MSDSDNKAPTTQMVSEDVNNEESGEVTDKPVPAAAPLGTDAEAGGHPPTKEELRIAREGDKDDEE